MEIKPNLQNIAMSEVLGLGAALAVPQSMEHGIPYVAIPKDFHVVDLEGKMAQPVRARGNVALGDVASFIRYTNKHKDEPKESAVDDDVHTVILADVINSKFKTIFDHHKSDVPGWAQHSATYDCPLSKEWQTWMAHNGKGKAKDQEEFAFFIEQNILDVVSPPGATMLQIVTTLKSTKNVQFDTGIRLNDGQVQLKYHEEAKTTAGAAGDLMIPERIALGIPVYMGAANYQVEAMFRYRIDGSRLALWYDIVQPQKILEHALNKVIAEVEAGTKIKPYSVTSF